MYESNTLFKKKAIKHHNVQKLRNSSFTLFWRRLKVILDTIWHYHWTTS